MKFGKKEMSAFGFGAIGKDMVYALSASFVMYYYQDILGISAAFVGTILMIARVFDAVNDPFMGVVVAKTNTKWGRFRPWVLLGTVLNAIVLVYMFNVPELSGSNFMQRSFGERVAMNSPIQGTAADIIKIAMIAVHDRLLREGLRSRLILQIHDELLVEAYEEETEQVRGILREEMMGAATLKVALEIDMHVGGSWYDAK